MSREIVMQQVDYLRERLGLSTTTTRWNYCAKVSMRFLRWKAAHRQ